MNLEDLLVLYTLCWISQGQAYFITNDIDPIMGYEPDPTDSKTYPKREFSHTSMHKKYFTGSNVIKFQKKDHEDIVDSHFKLLKPKTIRTMKDLQYSDMNLGLADMSDKNEKLMIVSNVVPQPVQQLQAPVVQSVHQQPLQVVQPGQMHALQSGVQIHSITASPYNPSQAQPPQQIQTKQAVQVHQIPAQQKPPAQEERNAPNRRKQNFNSALPQQSIQLNTNILSEQKKFIRQNYMPNIVRPNHGRYGTIKPAIERIARHDQMFPKMDYTKDNGNFDHDFAMFYRVPSQFAQGNQDQHDYGNGVFVGNYN